MLHRLACFRNEPGSYPPLTLSRVRRPGRQSRARRRARMECLEPRTLLAAVIWDGGGGDNHWTTAENWLNDVPPVPGDSLVFDGTGVATVNDFSAGTAFESLRFQGNGFSVSGNALTLTPSDSVAIESNVLDAIIRIPLILGSDATFAVGPTPSGLYLDTQATIDTNGFTLTHTSESFAVSNNQLLGVISGSGGLTVEGTGTGVILGGLNTYSGLTTVRSRMLRIVGQGTLGDGSSGTIVEPGASLAIDTTVPVTENVTISGLGFQGDGALRSVGSYAELSGSLTLQGDARIKPWGGQTQFVISGPIDDGGSNAALEAVLYSGSTLVLSGDSSHTGLTTTSTQGTWGNLQIDGSLTGDLTVQDAATLQGSGQILGEVTMTAGTTLSPGDVDGIGSLTVGSVQFDQGSMLHVDFDAGSGIGDQLQVTNGPANLGSATLDLQPIGAPSIGDSFSILTSPSVNGTFDGLNDLSQFAVGVDTFEVDYAATDVVVSVVQPSQPPTIDSSQPFEFDVPENTVTGTVVGTVAASDPDPDDALSYAIVGGTGSSVFSIDAPTGEILVADGNQLNFEVTNGFTLDVEVSDPHGLTASATFSVNVTDVSEPPKLTAQAFSIAENSPIGTVLGIVLADDGDTGQTLSYAITGGTGSTAFAIDANNGLLTVLDSTQLDFELRAHFTLDLQVSDNAAPPLSSTATITITVINVNELPQIGAQSFGTDESTANGTVLGKVVASDVDPVVGGGRGEGRGTVVLTYTIVGGSGTTAFAVDSADGTLSVLDSAQLDFETSPSLSIDVEVSDAGMPPLSASATMTILLTDVNESTVAQDIAESAVEDGPSITSLFVANDPDSNDTPATLVYTVLTAPAEGSVVNNNDGTFTFDPGLDFQDLHEGETREVSFQYTATDLGGLISNPATVTVTVSGANDGEPTAMPGGPYSVDEGSTIVLDASGSSDPDGTIVLYEWDLDYDGITFAPDVTGVNATFDATSIDGYSTREIALRVTDDQGKISLVVTQTATINNVAPTLALTGSPNVDEGSVYSLTWDAVTDPGMDTVTEYVIHWGDGESESWSAPGTYTHTYANGDSTSRSITVDLVDEDGTHAAAGSKNVTVRNVKPTIYFDLTNFPAVYGNDGSFQLTGFFTDPGFENWTVSVDYGETTGDVTNTIVQDPNDPSLYSFVLSYTYGTAPNGGAYRVETTVSDDVGSDIHRGSTVITVGTVGNNDIDVKVGSIIVTIDGVVTTFPDADQIVVMGLEGDDTITINASIDVPAILLGGPGNDVMIGGSGDNTFDGGEGNDIIHLGPGNNDVENPDPSESLDAFVVENKVQPLALGSSTRAITLTGEGRDNSLFEVNANNTLQFITPPDFENPLNDGDIANSYEVELWVDDGQGGSYVQRVNVSVLNQPSIVGTVYVDTDEDGHFDANEAGLNGVVIQLLDVNGEPVVDDDGIPVTATTIEGGFYLFEDVEPSTYRIQQVQPSGVDDGFEQIGSLGGTIVSEDTMRLTLERIDALDYNFAELGQTLGSGDTASIGFWQNKHGQSLIASGGSSLADWLSSSFSNVFGTRLVGADGPDVAEFYREQLFLQKSQKSVGPAKVDAQFMAIALSVYFTSRTLADDVATSYGLNVTDTGVGAKIVNVGENGEACNVDDFTDLTVLQLLLATDSLTDMPNAQLGFSNVYDRNGDGVIDSDEAALRSRAKVIYSSVLESGVS